VVSTKEEQNSLLKFFKDLLDFEFSIVTSGLLTYRKIS
jgi:hypothetical protein